LVELIQKHQLVEMEPLGTDYILYGVGETATDEPFEHYDLQTGENIPLYATEEEYKKEDDKLAESMKEPQARLAKLDAEIRKTPRRDRARRSVLLAETAESQKSIAVIAARKKLLESFYKNTEQRRKLLSE